MNMGIQNKTTLTAVLATAVICLMLTLGGCVGSRQFDDLNAKLDKIEASNRRTMEKVEDLDSVITESNEADIKLRNDIRVTVDEMNRQMANLLESYDQLMQMLHEVSSKQGSRLYSSPGADTYEPSGDQTEPTAVRDTTPPPPINCDTAFDDSFILMRQGEWDKAVEGYQEFLRYCPNHEKVESALYWSGESYYSLEKYAEAIEQFEKLTEEFKGSNLLSAALYKMARSHQELGQKDQARSIYQRLTKEFEGTLEAQQAKERLKDL